MLEILRTEGSLAYQLLASRLKDWELYQMTLRIERTAEGEPDGEICAEQFFESFIEELRHTSAHDSSTISTIHAMQAIVSDTTTCTSRIMKMYRIAGIDLLAEAESLAPNNIARQIEIRNLEESPLNSEPYHEANTKTPSSLAKFGTDLTRLAREGKIDPVIGRDSEIERVVQILSRRKKNNPVLIGDAGVGKSAIVEGLALRIASGDVPLALSSKRLFALDMASLVAGTKFRGEFEERLQQLLDTLQQSKNTILFIDELHTIVGAGATQGSLDTANILKPALARGELRIIGATTYDEYRENIERDSALERRFQRVTVEPTTRDETLEILRQVAPHYEQHHSVRFEPTALEACVTLADLFITDRHFPDKALDLLDEAGSRAHLATTSTPEHLRSLEEALLACRNERREAVKSASYELASAVRLREIALRSKLGESRSEWQRKSASNPAIVTAEDIAKVVTSMTGIPLERITGSEAERLKNLESELASRVVGQRDAIARIARSIRRSRAGLKDEKRPIGVFIFVGSTGVGKTLLAKELSRLLFDQRRGLIRIDMSEYTERHSIARLIGSPPGYVGYGEGGQLTEAVRRRPYSVVLFDEIEKAHSELFNTMLQIFDEGHLTDSSGRTVDFRNTIIIMTSNLGSRDVASQPNRVGYATTARDGSKLSDSHEEYRKALERTFAPEFLNRVDDVVVFRPLDKADIEQIVEIELRAVITRAERLGFSIVVTPQALRALADMGFEERYGARSLKRTITEQVEHPLSTMIIEGSLREGGSIVVDHSDKRIILRANCEMTIDN